jgi:hypothetical protein
MLPEQHRYTLPMSNFVLRVSTPSAMFSKFGNSAGFGDVGGGYAAPGAGPPPRGTTA